MKGIFGDSDYSLSNCTLTTYWDILLNLFLWKIRSWFEAHYKYLVY